MTSTEKDRRGAEVHAPARASCARRHDAKSTAADDPTQRHRSARDAGGGFDPYNSSGSFDRKKNWERVGKR